MRICVAGGMSKADFLIKFFLEKGHHIVVINENEKQCEYLSKKYDIEVYCSNPAYTENLLEAEVENFDVLVSLKQFDYENLKVCQIAKKIGVKKVVAVVNDPTSVEIFQKLGIHNTISATYATCKFIEQASEMQNIANALDLADDKIIISNVMVEEDSPVLNKALWEIKMPHEMIIASILRKSGLIIPKGNTIITLGDKLLVVSSDDAQKDAISFLTGK